MPTLCYIWRQARMVDDGEAQASRHRIEGRL